MSFLWLCSDEDKAKVLTKKANLVKAIAARAKAKAKAVAKAAA